MKDNRPQNTPKKRGAEAFGIALILTALFGLIFLIFGNYLPFVGGGYIRGFLLGAFGWASFACCLAAVLAGVALFRKFKAKLPLSKILLLSGMLVSGFLIIHQISAAGSFSAAGNYGEYLSLVYAGQNTAGGAFTGLFAYPVTALTGTVISYIFYSLVFAALALFAFGILPPGKKGATPPRQRENFSRDPLRDAQPVNDNIGASLYVSDIIRREPQAASRAASGYREQYYPQQQQIRPFNAGYPQTRHQPQTVSQTTAEYDSARKLLYAGAQPQQSPQPQPQKQGNFAYQQQQLQQQNFPKYIVNNTAVQTEAFPKRPPMVVHEEKPAAQPVEEIQIRRKIVNGEERSRELQQNRSPSAVESACAAALAFEESEPPNIINGEERSSQLQGRKTDAAQPALAPEKERVVPKSNIAGFEEQYLRMHGEFAEKPTADSVIPTGQPAAAQDPEWSERVDYKSYYAERTAKSKPRPPINLAPQAFDDGDDGGEFELYQEAEDFCDIDTDTDMRDVRGFTGRVDAIESYINPQDARAARGGRRPESGQVSMEDYLQDSAPEPETRPYKDYGNYSPPPLDLLVDSTSYLGIVDEECREKGVALEETLAEFNAPARVVKITKGPAVTLYEMQTEPGIPVRRVATVASDIAYNLAAHGKIRIKAPIMGKQAVGIEVPNKDTAVVSLRSVIDSDEFYSSQSPLTVAIGKNIAGETIVADLIKLTHLLIAGQTNSGKSCCLNSIIVSLIYKSSPEDLKLILVDPKLVEFTNYQGLPHMLFEKPITSVDAAIKVLQWAGEETDRRFGIFARMRVRDIHAYNRTDAVVNKSVNKMQYIVIIVDELGELMQAGRMEINASITKLAQKARAAGIHLVLATQRPSVDVITGVIKANLTSRIAFLVPSNQDSRTILSEGGAETLLGRGDMLFSPSGCEPQRIQGAYVDGRDIDEVVNFVNNNNAADFDSELERRIYTAREEIDDEGDLLPEEVMDPLFITVLRAFIDKNEASTSFIQRRWGVGFNRAARIIDQMEMRGYISPKDATNKRTVIITIDQFLDKFGES